MSKNPSNAFLTNRIKAKKSALKMKIVLIIKTAISMKNDEKKHEDEESKVSRRDNARG